MSTGLELIPLAIAIGVAVNERRKARAEVAGSAASAIYAMETRLRDRELLVRAFARLGANADDANGTLTATLGGTKVSLALPPGADVYDAHFSESVPEQHAREVVLLLDEAYCAVVQQTVRDKVMERATAHGLAVASETVEEDGSLVLTLEVTQ